MSSTARSAPSAAVAARLLAHRKQEMSVPLSADVYPWYRKQLAQHRIAFDERRSAWAVFRYAEVQQVMLDTDTFSSQRTLKPDGSVDEIGGAGMISTDPPRHRHLRSLAVQAFTQKRVAQLEPRIREVTKDLLDAFHGKDVVDAIAGLAFPLPVTIIAELLGIASSDNDKFHRWAADFISNDYGTRMKTAGDIAGYFDQLVTYRQRHPGEDLISQLLRAEADGQEMTRAEVTGMCLLLLIAGHETTMGLLGNTLWCLDEHPDAQTELAAHPDLIPGALEEVLRYRSVVHYIARVVMHDIRYLDHDLKAGDLVLPLFAAANLDGSQFPDPDRFDIRRTPNRHMGFGYGIHLCLGAALARLESQIAMTELLARYPRLRRDSTATLELRQSSVIYSLRRYPVRLKG